MAPEDRRAALIAATIPLLHEHGLDVSTRQIAQAAGVAEGTIFGVFPDKLSLLSAAIVQAFDPAPTLDAVAAIDPGGDLRVRLSAAATLIMNRFARNARLMAAAGHGHHAKDPAGIARMNRAREQLLAALTELIEPDAALLRRTPAEVARLVLLFCGANTFGPFADHRFDGDELVSLLLDGLLVPPDHSHGGV
ncbi:hypothetical protein Aau02nite_41920 [Amorphoplanes auranticolor]|uniref:HTH tetR-type domain-containing protein n=2 Tax=Actinoplanes auranticolor TaxID=47988 RepID=A0A919VV78_9ACTN|nr:hypothetical protein Aau02nite_41920 [Actinoplanes auranticolor]